ncbi:hypothetical protein [Sphingobacterium sp. LRF_L2]|uniref:hypothetical protein n=1 Tax=Sphingobacterium sp. LRF_L2 TaxID=3369421 RepID=UPI003F62F50A
MQGLEFDDAHHLNSIERTKIKNKQMNSKMIIRTGQAMLFAAALFSTTLSVHAERNLNPVLTVQETALVYTAAEATSFFANGRNLSYTAPAGTVTVYIDLDENVGGFERWADLHSGKGIKLLLKPNGQVVAVQDGVELSLRQIQFNYTGGVDAYWDELAENDATNSIVVQKH